MGLTAKTLLIASAIATVLGAMGLVRSAIAPAQSSSRAAMPANQQPDPAKHSAPLRAINGVLIARPGDPDFEEHRARAMSLGLSPMASLEPFVAMIVNRSGRDVVAYATRNTVWSPQTKTTSAS